MLAAGKGREGVVSQTPPPPVPAPVPPPVARVTFPPPPTPSKSSPDDPFKTPRHGSRRALPPIPQKWRHRRDPSAPAASPGDTCQTRILPLSFIGVRLYLRVLRSIGPS
eukprot:1189745-Prorocentrum_minimum.AAC.2